MCEHQKENESLIAQSRAEGANLTDVLGVWISVTERLPGDGEPPAMHFCIVAKTNKVVLEAMFNSKIKKFLNTNSADLNHDVTHWMPLPEAPNMELTRLAEGSPVERSGTKVERRVRHERTAMKNDIELPEAAAHMYPSDLEKFKNSETFAHAYSIAVGNPDERSVPLFTLSDMVAYAKAVSNDIA